ncbi:DUF2752 domain-containing protein [Angustibacter luteus]|uniref:DUF2752 domain-containing protein n=1 Tax=Angustibacter luteus TaxID=658456 RepID=A0ABW1J9J1_9ACTN
MTAAGLPRRTAAPAAVAGGVAALALALALRDPHVAGSWGHCPFLALTGLPCPFCGGLRAVWELEHGSLSAAASSNLLVVLVLPLALVSLLAWWRRCLRGRGGTGSRRSDRLVGPAAVAGLLVVLGFGVLRWLPALGWLAP